jgi:hypothetical protein
MSTGGTTGGKRLPQQCLKMTVCNNNLPYPGNDGYKNHRISDNYNRQQHDVPSAPVAGIVTS